MRPASGIEQEPKSLWHSWAGWVLVVGVALLAGSLGVAVASWLARRKTTLSGPLAAHQVALKELARIEALNLPAQGELERYHTELSNLMRHYLEQRFQLAATRQTTVEFLESMRSANCLTADQQAMLRAFLEQCDLAKFARLPPTVEQSVALANAVRRFLQQTASAPPGAVR